MDAQNDEIEQSTTELKYLGFVKEIAVKFLVLLSNVYEFAKENSGVLKTTINSAEKAVVYAVGPIYEDAKDLPEKLLQFIDGKLEKYAPAPVKNLTIKLQSLTKKATPIVEKLVTTAWSLVAPIICTALSLLQKALTVALSLLQKALTVALSLLQKLIMAIQSIPFISKTQALLQARFTTATSSIHSLLEKAITIATSSIQPILLKAITTATSSIQSLLPTTSSIQSLLQSGPNIASQLLDDTKAAVSNVPVIGKATQSLITNSTDFANQLVNTTTDLVKENPVLNTVNTAAQDIVKEAQASGTKLALKSAFESFKLVALPVIAQLWYKANKYPVFNAVAEVVLPVVEWVSDWYNKVVKYMDGKGYRWFGYLVMVPIDEMKAAYKVVKMAMDGLSAMGGIVGMDS